MLNFIDFKKITSIGTLAILMSGTLMNSPAFSNSEEFSDATNASGVVTPNSYTKDIAFKQTISVDRSVVVSIDDIVETITTTTPVDKLDVLFLADNTGSMSDGIANVQNNAASLLNSLESTYDDLQVGVAKYYGDPQEVKTWKWEVTGIDEYVKNYTYTDNYYYNGCYNWNTGSYETCYEYTFSTKKNGSPLTGWWNSGTTYVFEDTALEYGDYHSVYWESDIYELTPDTYVGATGAYELQESVNGGTKGDAIAAINQWSASGGDDWAEANFFALHQAATSGTSTSTGYSTGYNTNWRDDAKKIIVWFGDAESHTNTVSQQQAIDALNAQDITVVAIHTVTTATSATNGLDSGSQASSIATATDGEYASVYNSELAGTIESLIGTAAVETTTTTITPSIDLTFSSQGTTDGLDITYTCSDVLGCNNVKNGDSRTFTMEITGNKAGNYSFKTVVDNVNGAEADNNIKILIAD